MDLAPAYNVTHMQDWDLTKKICLDFLIESIGEHSTLLNNAAGSTSRTHLYIPERGCRWTPGSYMTASPILPQALKGAPNYPADQQDREEHCPLTPINDVPPCKQKWETHLFPYGPYSDAMVKIYTSVTWGNDHIQVLMYFEFQKDNWV